MKKIINKTEDIPEINLLKSFNRKKRDFSSLFNKSDIREGKESTFYDTSIRDVWGNPLEQGENEEKSINITHL